MTKLYKFVDVNNKVVGVSYSDANGNITAPSGATAIEITEDQKSDAIAQQQADMPTLFNPDLIMAGAFQIFQGNILTVMGLVGMLRELMNFQNWAEIAVIRDQLVSAGTITQVQADNFTALFTAQGIDLANL